MNINAPFWLLNLKAKDVTFLTFYRYTTCVTERLISIERREPSHFSTFFDELLIAVERVEFICEDGKPKMGKFLMDNKIAFKIQLKTETILYVGYYDGVQSIGLSVNSDSWVKPYPAKIQAIDSQVIDATG